MPKRGALRIVTDLVLIDTEEPVAPMHGSEHILLDDDDEMVREIFSSILMEAGDDNEASGFPCVVVPPKQSVNHFSLQQVQILLKTNPERIVKGTPWKAII
jgi:hypothetical protein